MRDRMKDFVFGPIYIRPDPSGKCVRLGLLSSKLDMDPQTARELAAKIEEAAMCVENNLFGHKKAETFNPYLGEDHGQRQTSRIEE